MDPDQPTTPRRNRFRFRRRPVADSEITPGAASEQTTTTPPRPRRRIGGWILLLLVILAVTAVFLTRRHFRQAMNESLPRIDGQLVVYGLSAPVNVQRDGHGVPHISAASMDDLIMAQGFVTAQDRLWQMDLLRRHAAGELAALEGRALLEHDRLQRTLQLRAAADRAWLALPPDQKHWLEVYSRGVNAAIASQRSHLPIEFRLIGYQPAPWAPRDCLLIELAMYQDLTTGFPAKLGREALSQHLSPELIADLYPVGSWRDHPPTQPIPDLSAPIPDFKDIPLDESRSSLRTPGGPYTDATELQRLQQALWPFRAPCPSCVAGSNAWVVAGAHTDSGKPILSNDMHLALSVPDLWYEADLRASNSAPIAPFHAMGVTIPGAPFVIAGRNDQVSWGFTNLGADVQDLYIEHTRGTASGAEYQGSDGIWRAVRYQREIIQVRGGGNVTLDVPLTHHGDADTPIVTSIFPGETRSISLRWTIYDPSNLVGPFFAIDTAVDGLSLVNAFSTFGGPPQNLMYADAQGHIGYHAVGRIPVRGDINSPSALTPVPTDVSAPDATMHEWAGYIPFDQLPQSIDPPNGFLATANARVTPDGYRYPITLNWLAPYRTERIYRVLQSSVAKVQAPGPSAAFTPTRPLGPSDMLALQTDVFSELDQVIAQRIAYSIDHASGPLKQDKTLHDAADILRKWNGSVDADSAAAAIVNAERQAFWPMLLIPKLAPQFASQLAQNGDVSKIKDLPPDVARTGNLWQSYVWGEKDSVEEELITHAPARWLPPGYANWNDFLASVTLRGLHNAKAPRDLASWKMGNAFPLDLEHPFLGTNRLFLFLLGLPTGTGPRAESGDLTTVKQVGHAFGPSERFTTELGNADRTTLNIVTGQSGNPSSPWFLDQFEDWLNGRTYSLSFSSTAAPTGPIHTLTLTPR
jgi:penicillin amidase